MQNSLFQLKFKDKILNLDNPKVMAIINVTPDSFSDGGRFDIDHEQSNLDKILYYAESCINAGAAILDIGGESTRPYATPLPYQQELDRIIPVIEALNQRFDCWLSIDTYKTIVMTEAIHAGVSLINDVNALQDQGAIALVAKHQIPTCLMHMKGTPQTMQITPSYEALFDEIILFFNERIQMCLQAGIKKEQLLIDPGFGFGKNDQHNYQLLANLKEFKLLNNPLLIGLSHKGMIFRTNNKTATNCVLGSVAGAVIAALNGAHIIRVHDVAQTIEALEIVQATLRQQRH